MNVVLSTASQAFGRYELLEYLGSGGMSDVFVAMHTGLQKRVALKVLRRSLRHDPEAVRRFLREAECAARVSHPNVVHVTDVGTEQGIPFLVMELLDGETLEDKLMREGPFALDAAVDLLLPILDAVAATHEAGVLHRDIKPGNILLARMRDGSVVPKLVDFGIATLAERGAITGAISPIGTPHYMSPEQARGAEVDFRSDMYSLASMLFELVTGKPPFGEGKADEVLARVAKGCFPRARALCPSLPRALDEVLARATAFSPAERFASIEELMYALVPFASERTRKLWISRNERKGVLSAHLLSGTFRFDEPASAPVAQSARSTHDLAPKRRRARLAHAAWFCVLGLSVCSAFILVAARLEAEPLRIAASSAPVLLDTPPQNVQANHLPLAPKTQRLVALSPAHATAFLDGRPLGHGVVALPLFSDGEMHELRVSAERHVTRVLLFRDTLDVTRIALEPLD